MESTTLEIDPVQMKFDDQEARFVELESNISVLRAFIAKHRETLAPFHWSCYGYDKSITFWGGMSNDAKSVARAFGADGWTREHSGVSCGSVNWKKPLDGVVLLIEAAENIKPKLIESVKIS